MANESRKERDHKYHKYYQQNRDKILERERRKILFRQADFASNREYMDARNKHRQRRYVKMKLSAQEALGGKCAECGVDDPRVLHIDHTHGGGSEERKILKNIITLYRNIIEHGSMNRYQLLCANCHMIKHIRSPEIKDLIKELKFNRWPKKRLCEPE